MSPDSISGTRRDFLALAGGGALSIATTGSTRHITGVVSSPDPWLGPLSGKHKMYFDATSAAGKWALAYAMNWLTTAPAAYGEKESEFSAVLGVRHYAVVMALNDSIWAKYPIGAMVNVLDSQTKMPAKRNIFYNSKPGDLSFDDSAIEKLQARGMHMVACGVALTVIASMAGDKVGVSATDAHTEFMNSLLPGVKVVPSGVLAVSHAQEKGCTYCYAE